MTFVDIGANVGYYTLLASLRVGPTGTVFGFEPAAEVYPYLEGNIRRNAASNVVVSNLAVAEGEGMTTFTPSAFEGGFLTGVNHQPHGHLGVTPESVRVDVTSLDLFMEDRGWPPIDLVKVDVEGSEARVLAGMKRVSAKNANLRLIIELNLNALQRAGTNLHELRQLLISLGFDVGYVIEKGLTPIPLHRHLPRSGLIYNMMFTKPPR